jgi:fatty-acid desaturase
MFNFSHPKVIRSLQIFTQLLGLFGLIVGYLHPDYLILSLIVFYIFSSVGISIGFHRYLSHRSFETNKFWHIVMSVMGTLLAQGSSIAWVAVHRQHHKYADKDKDPHSIHQIGGVRSWLTFWDVKLEHNTKDLLRDPVQRWLHKHYLEIHLSLIAILGIIDPWLIVYAYSLPVALSLHTSGLFNVAAHWHGYRNFDTPDKSYNIWYVNLFGLGEGWHNNHHRYPKKYTTKVNWWEIDPLSWFIKAIKV